MIRVVAFLAGLVLGTAFLLAVEAVDAGAAAPPEVTATIALAPFAATCVEWRTSFPESGCAKWAVTPAGAR